MFEVAEAYEVMMGRWSRQLAPLFVEFVGVQDVRRCLMLDVELEEATFIWLKSMILMLLALIFPLT